MHWYLPPGSIINTISIHIPIPSKPLMSYHCRNMRTTSPPHRHIYMFPNTSSIPSTRVRPLISVTVIYLCTNRLPYNRIRPIQPQAWPTRFIIPKYRIRVPRFPRHPTPSICNTFPTRLTQTVGSYRIPTIFRGIRS